MRRDLKDPIYTFTKPTLRFLIKNNLCLGSQSGCGKKEVLVQSVNAGCENKP